MPSKAIWRGHETRVPSDPYGATSGVTELEDLFSKMIREGMITREEALERLAKENFIPRPVVDDVLANVDLELADLHLDSTRQISG